MAIGHRCDILRGLSTRSVFTRWAIAGSLLAGVMLWGQQSAVGGITGLLQVGEASDLRPVIEGELGEVPLAADAGHDGQIFYVMGLDLGGEEAGSLLDHPGYRYRRILYPALASMFGLLGGRELLVGMMAVTVISTGLAGGAAAALAVRRGVSQYMGLAVVLNPGVWLSIRLLTSDILALALMLLGLLLLATRPLGSVAGFALSTLAKDPFLVTPAGLAVRRSRRSWLPLVVSVAVLGAWTLFVTARMGSGSTALANLALPFAGWIESWPTWQTLSSPELFYLAFALVSVLAGLIVGARRSSWLRWPILGWSMLAVVSSHWVWDLGNNAARAFAPIVVLIALSFGADRPGPMAAAAPVSAPDDLP
jgi:hypothetical protein